MSSLVNKFRRLAAAEAGGPEVDLTVGDYDDSDMVGVIVKETLPQRGCSAAAAIDSVAATARLVAKEVLLSERRQRKVADRDVETLTITEIEQALASLKASGRMTAIMSEVYGKVEALREAAVNLGVTGVPRQHIIHEWQVFRSRALRALAHA